MKAKKLLIATMFSSIAAACVATLTFAPKLESERLRANGEGYTCASLHFGMDDESLEGFYHVNSDGAIAVNDTAYTYSGDNIIGSASGITIQSYKVEGWTIWHVANKGLKLSKSDKHTTLTFNLGSNIVGVTIYAVGWYKSSDSTYHSEAKISVNGSSQVRLYGDSLFAGNSEPSQKSTYRPYYFELEETNKLTIATYKQVCIGDIAFRVKA